MHYIFKRQELTFLDFLKNIATVGVLKGKLPPLTCKKKKVAQHYNTSWS